MCPETGWEDPVHTSPRADVRAVQGRRHPQLPHHPHQRHARPQDAHLRHHQHGPGRSHYVAGVLSACGRVLVAYWKAHQPHSLHWDSWGRRIIFVHENRRSFVSVGSLCCRFVLSMPSAHSSVDGFNINNHNSYSFRTRTFTALLSLLPTAVFRDLFHNSLLKDAYQRNESCQLFLPWLLMRRKTAAHADRPASDFICALCNRDCHSCIGLTSHTQCCTRINTLSATL